MNPAKEDLRRAYRDWQALFTHLLGNLLHCQMNCSAILLFLCLLPILTVRDFVRHLFLINPFSREIVWFSALVSRVWSNVLVGESENNIVGLHVYFLLYIPTHFILCEVSILSSAEKFFVVQKVGVHNKLLVYFGFLLFGHYQWRYQLICGGRGSISLGIT